jgi:uncharacterized protein (TIGR00369 family)
MGYSVLSRSQLQIAVPKLAEMAKDGFIAAYEGPGGTYVVYSPRVAAGMTIGGKPVHLATYISQPTMIVVPGKRWEEGDANACAQALAMQDLDAVRDGTVLVLKQEDVDRVCGRATPQPQTDDPSSLQPPISKLLGMQALSFASGAASIELSADDRLFGPLGALHTGALCDLADLAMGAACKTTLADDQTFQALELKINFVKVVGRATLKADAKVKKRGSQVVLVECSITDETTSLVALVTGSYLVSSK